MTNKVCTKSTKTPLQNTFFAIRTTRKTTKITIQALLPAPQMNKIGQYL